MSVRPPSCLAPLLKGRLLAVCLGCGVDSTAMLVALRLAGLRPDIITFADTGAEQPETMAHLDRMNTVLEDWRWDPIVICRKVPLASTGYADLYGNCISNETLPSLAFGLKSCSVKWKSGQSLHPVRCLAISIRSAGTGAVGPASPSGRYAEAPAAALHPLPRVENSRNPARSGGAMLISPILCFLVARALLAARRSGAAVPEPGGMIVARSS